MRLVMWVTIWMTNESCPNAYLPPNSVIIKSLINHKLRRLISYFIVEIILQKSRSISIRVHMRVPFSRVLDVGFQIRTYVAAKIWHSFFKHILILGNPYVNTNLSSWTEIMSSEHPPFFLTTLESSMYYVLTYIGTSVHIYKIQLGAYTTISVATAWKSP